MSTSILDRVLCENQQTGRSHKASVIPNLTHSLDFALWAFRGLLPSIRCRRRAKPPSSAETCRKVA